MQSQLIDGGYIIVARRLLESGIFQKPHLYIKLWLWMIMQARFKDHRNLKRGQFVTSIDQMRDAMTYKIGYRTERPSRKEIRCVYDFLTKGHMIVTMKVTHGFIITICNYDLYQDIKNYERHSEGHDEGQGRGIINRKKERKKENQEKVFAEISELRSRYSCQELINQVFEAIASTRKTGIVKDSVSLKQLKLWDKYTVSQVENGIRVYLDKNCASDGKDEKYLLGIIRKQSDKPNSQDSQLENLLAGAI
jgi:hypothetical protein